MRFKNCCCRHHDDDDDDDDDDYYYYYYNDNCATYVDLPTLYIKYLTRIEEGGGGGGGTVNLLLSECYTILP